MKGLPVKTRGLESVWRPRDRLALAAGMEWVASGRIQVGRGLGKAAARGIAVGNSAKVGTVSAVTGGLPEKLAAFPPAL